MKKKIRFLYLNDLKNSKKYKFIYRILLFYPNSNSSDIICMNFRDLCDTYFWSIQKNSFDFIVSWIVFLVRARSSMKSFYTNVSSYYVNEKKKKKNISDGLYEFISRHINVILQSNLMRVTMCDYDVQGNATSFILSLLWILIVSPFPFMRQRKTVQRLNFPVSD